MWITGNYQRIRAFYRDVRVWQEPDKWHRHVHRVIAERLATLRTSMSQVRVIANLGSGGRAFGLSAELHVHVDLLPDRLPRCFATVALVEQLPLRDGSADFVVSVGSVINHTDAFLAIKEMARIVRTGGVVIVEFDCADGLHRSSPRSHGLVITDTFYNRHMLRLVEYRRDRIEQFLTAQGLFIRERLSFHIISGLLLRWKVPADVASWFAGLDAVARFIPVLRYRGSHMFLVAQAR
jgi:SAM-dependent methyltransferase